MTKIVDFRVRVPQALWPPVTPPDANISQYEAVLQSASKTATANTLDHLLAAMDEQGIGHAVMHAEHEFGDVADALNGTVADILAKHPDRFTGIGTISLDNFSIKRALAQVDHCHNTGMIGLSIEPAFFHMAIGDKRLYPVYAKAQEKNICVALHTGINYSLIHPMEGENPLEIDKLACDFPDLVIIAAHGGWPWIPEMVAVARKHPNVFIEFGGLAPRYVGATGSGWEVMHRFMNSVLKDQILYGTDWPTMDHARTVKEWRALDLKSQVFDALMHDNAHKLIKRLRA